jgi:hypothetical protein
MVFACSSKEIIFVKCLATSTTIPSPTHCPAKDVPAVLGIKVMLFLVANAINPSSKSVISIFFTNI